MVKTKKNPWISAILNIVLWGLGYIYNGKRIIFGILLILADLSIPIVALPFTFLNPVFWFFAIILTVAFGYDAYREAQKINKKR